ncbi:hypothetical protein AB0L53_06135 [Nonomuraea sp. NPDC052129]|uniref:hypothetical protein n=1 Tax=Nonomuraea sp. NPDC052129 TaxID=3154651 RepID=UPI003431EFA2
MKAIRRTITTALSALTVAGGLLAFGAPAEAASQCTSTGVGYLCVNIDPRGYDASYQKVGGSTAHVDFNLVCANGRWFGDEGSFYISAGETRTYTFAVGSQGSCFLKLIDMNTGATWQTPSISR